MQKKKKKNTVLKATKDKQVVLSKSATCYSNPTTLAMTTPTDY